MNSTLKVTTLALLIALFAGFNFPAIAGPFEDGLAAEGRGAYTTALKLFRELADSGQKEAQNSLGVMYAKGLGVAQDFAEAAKWYRLAANQGNAVAQYNLGSVYLDGRGVARDYAEAVKW